MANLLSPQEIANMIGSWHNQGYHGHNRAKSRIEFSNIYRQSAKPKPPEKFRVRQRDDAYKHVFSNHDNKQIFLNDPTLFGSGIGKKKIDSKYKSRWNPEFISWSESSERDRFKKTIYQNDFCSNGNIPRLLTARKTVENRPISVYNCNYSHNEPSTESSKQTREDTYYRFLSNHRAKSCVGERLTVANCLVWHDKQKAPERNTSTFTSEPKLEPLQIRTEETHV